MNKNIYHPYTNSDGKRVNGAAALNHYMYTVKGGVQNYHDEIGAEYIAEFVKEHSDIIHDGLAKKAERERFRIVS
jgi:hypothetical protein